MNRPEHPRASVTALATPSLAHLALAALDVDCGAGQGLEAAWLCDVGAQVDAYSEASLGKPVDRLSACRVSLDDWWADPPEEDRLLHALAVRDRYSLAETLALALARACEVIPLAARVLPAACGLADPTGVVMTEDDWLEGAHPLDMLDFAAGKVSVRKLRLFAAACCRAVGQPAAALACECAADGLADLPAPGDVTGTARPQQLSPGHWPGLARRTIGQHRCDPRKVVRQLARAGPTPILNTGAKEAVSAAGGDT